MCDARIVVIGVNYRPEATGIGPYTTGFAEQLAEAGATVTVVTAVPHYPAWKGENGYANGARDTGRHNDVTICRVRPPMPARMSAATRAIFEAGFGFRAKAVASTIQADAMIGIVPSLAGAGVAAWIAHRRAIP